jgi:hypothetical protein
VAVAHGERLGGLDETARALGVFFDIHKVIPSACRSAPSGTETASSLGFRCSH